MLLVMVQFVFVELLMLEFVMTQPFSVLFIWKEDTPSDILRGQTGMTDPNAPPGR